MKFVEIMLDMLTSAYTRVDLQNSRKQKRISGGFSVPLDGALTSSGTTLSASGSGMMWIKPRGRCLTDMVVISE